MHYNQFTHEAKSNLAYLYDKDTVHIRLKVIKGVTTNVKLIYGDPFLYKAQEDTNRYAWAPFEDGLTMTHEYDTDAHSFFFLACKPTYKRMKYAFIIDDRYLFGSREIIDLNVHPTLRYNLFNYFNFPYLNEEDLFDAPDWTKNQVWYSVFTERFHNGNPSLNLEGTRPWGETEEYSNAQLYGGDIPGIIEKLDYIKDMGFTGIYFTPIFHAAATHKYDTIDYYSIDPAFGTNEDFKELVEQAHARGIKVMLDAVFNHCGLEHPFFLDVIKNGKNSRYIDCFYIHDKDKPVLPIEADRLKDMPYSEVKNIFKDVNELNYATFAFTPFMPKLNTMDPFMKDYLLDVAVHWIKHYNIDGWRLDVSNEIPHAFWREFRTAVKKANPEAYIVGENWDNSNPWLKGEQYDAVMNYEILFPMWQFFGTNIEFPSYTAEEFIHKINKVLTDYPKNVLETMYNLVDSHDTSRIMHQCDNNTSLVKLAYLFLFSFPGSPSVFYGGEVGLTGGHDPHNRACMEWRNESQDKDLQAFIKHLITLRKTHKAFSSTSFTWHPQDNPHALMYEKDDLLILINNSDTNTDFSLPKEFVNASCVDLINQDTSVCKDSVSLTPYQSKVYKKA